MEMPRYQSPNRRIGLVLAAALLGGAAPVTMPHPARNITLVAASDTAADTDFLLRLGMLEGHLMVGHDLLVAHQASLALPHFGHPVRELYDDISDYIDAHKFPAFDRQLVKLEAATAADPYSPDVEQKYQTAIATVHKARELAPASLRASVPAMIKICADTLDAAAGEYGGALEKGRVQVLVEYHDSRGFVSWVAQFLNGMSTNHADPASQSMLSQMKTVLAKAQWIVEPLLPSPTPRASVGQYRAVASEAEAVSMQR
jgi:hypothetical protein